MKELSVDTRIGGLGDVWMRLHALYALRGLGAVRRIRATVRAPLAEVAHTAFGARLIIDTEPSRGAIVFSHRGLSEILPRILRGEKFCPVFRTIIRHDGDLRNAREWLNDATYHFLSACGRVHLTERRYLEGFGGWLQVSGLPPARLVPWESARAQLTRDFPEIRQRLVEWVPPQPAPGRLVFPSGTSFQIMTPDFARTHLAGARFAFHRDDRYQEEFARPGLEIVPFATAHDLLRLAAGTQELVATDSFPSHLLQTYTARTVLALSHYPRRRIVHPAFDGRVVDSTATCCPCLTRSRKPATLCTAGRRDCLVWQDAAYLAQFRRELPL